FTQFLTLVGLAALLVGGVGVANAVKSHIDRRRDSIATLKSLGAPGRDVFAIYLMQVVVLAVIGSLIGLAVGAARAGFLNVLRCCPGGGVARLRRHAVGAMRGRVAGS
ncbi:FtsX-like permease family protein, partial [Mycobacterium tuberculosis]|nr:FtsX-like permease family protein [Mycobacterium tuberculosis]